MQKELGNNSDPTKLSIQSLKMKLQLKAKRRENELKDVLPNISLKIFEEKIGEQENHASYMNVMLCPWILILCLCCVSPVILIPQHDGVLFPEYWYELMINTNLTYNLGWTLALFYDIQMILNMSSMVSKWSPVKVFLISSLSFDIIYCILYCTWTYGLKYNYPVPFSNIALYISSGIYFVTIWYQFPKNVRDSKTEGMKIKSFLLLYIYTVVITLQFSALRKLFVKISPHLQWITAIVLPLLRYLNEKLMNLLGRRAAGAEKLHVKANFSISMNVYSSMFIAIAIGSLTTPLTSYCILGVDFLLNLYSCISIIRTHRRIDPQHLNSRNLETQKMDEVTMLVLTEIVEVLAPMLYILTFLIAYNGPNAKILGGIKNSYWNFDAVEDFGTVLSGVGLMFVFDIFFGLVSGIILWNFAEVNMLKQYCTTLKKFWPIITLRLATNSAKVY